MQKIENNNIDLLQNYVIDVANVSLIEDPTSGVLLPNWLAFSFLLFLAGLLGILFNYKNFLVTMLAVEMIYLGVISSFVLHGVVCNDPQGAIYGLFFLILAACESGVGLGILIVLYRFGKTVELSDYQTLHG